MTRAVRAKATAARNSFKLVDSVCRVNPRKDFCPKANMPLTIHSRPPTMGEMSVAKRFITGESHKHTHSLLHNANSLGRSSANKMVAMLKGKTKRAMAISLALSAESPQRNIKRG